MTLADILRQEGLERGLEQGLERGRKEALSETAILMLMEKFGSIPKEIKEGILNTEIESLKMLLMKGYTFETIEQVKRYIH